MNAIRERRDSIERRKADLYDETLRLQEDCLHNSNVMKITSRVNDEYDSHAWYRDNFKCTDCGKQWSSEDYQ